MTVPTHNPSYLYELFLATAHPEWHGLDVRKELELIWRKIGGDHIIPQAHLIFRILKCLAVSEVRVCLLGQDPYPTLLRPPEAAAADDPDATAAAEEAAAEADADAPPPLAYISQACGFSFSAPLGPLPPSLKTMFKEMATKPGRKSGDLSYLVADGVMLLNTALTLRVDNTPKGARAGSDTHTCWPCFTIKVLEYLRTHNPAVVYIALGEHAKHAYEAANIRNYVFTQHPAAGRYGKKPDSFVGSGVFKKVNAILVSRGLEEIDWEPMAESEVQDVKYYVVPPRIHKDT